MPDTATPLSGAWLMTRAAMWTAIPATCPLRRSISPVCSPTRISMPRRRTASVSRSPHVGEHELKGVPGDWTIFNVSTPRRGEI